MYMINTILGRYNDYQIAQDLTGKVAIVTGGSSGIGKVTCHELAAKGCHVIVAARNKEKTDPIIADIIAKTSNPKVEFMEIQLDDLKSVKDFAFAFLKRKLRLDILINNAGAAGIGGVTKQGFQSTFGINHLSHVSTIKF